MVSGGGLLMSYRLWLTNTEKRFIVVPRRCLIYLTTAIGLGISTWGAAANATPTLELISGTAGPVTIVAGPSGAATYSNADFNGWDVIISFGTSNSPGLSPYGLDLVNLVETCWDGTGCSDDPLEIYLSDIDFTQTTLGLAESYSATGVGVTTQTAYADTSNTLFGINTPTGGQTGTITLTNTDAGSAYGNIALPGGTKPYSLTLVDTFEPNNGAGVVYSSDGDVTVPEPTSLILFASSLMGFGWVDWRRKQS
jgi:PEP-CTERM motif